MKEFYMIWKITAVIWLVLACWWTIDVGQEIQFFGLLPLKSGLLGLIIYVLGFMAGWHFGGAGSNEKENFRAAAGIDAN